jgi:hypothetical protein
MLGGRLKHALAASEGCRLKLETFDFARNY